MSVSIRFKWEDIWIGAYIERVTDLYDYSSGFILYLCIVPMFPIKFDFTKYYFQKKEGRLK